MLQELQYNKHGSMSVLNFDNNYHFSPGIFVCLFRWLRNTVVVDTHWNIRTLLTKVFMNELSVHWVNAETIFMCFFTLPVFFCATSLLLQRRIQGTL